MPIQVHAPDGSTVEFPDGTDDATITGVLRREYGGPTAAPAKSSLLDQIGAFAQSATEQVPFLDEAAAKAVSMASGRTYEQVRGAQADLAQADREQRPGARNAGGVAGFGATVLAPIGGPAWIAKAKSLPQAVGRSAAIGAAYGGVTGAGSAEDGKRVEGGAKGAAFGAGMGGVIGPVVRGYQSAGNAVAKIGSPVLAEIEAAKNAAYEAVDQSGVKFKPEAFAKLATGVEATLAKAGVNPMRHPRAASMAADFRKLAEEGYAPTLSQLDQLRQVVSRDVVSASDKAERFMGRKIVDTIDQFIEGSPGGAPMAKARGYNQTFRKLEAVDTTVQKARDRAAGSGSGTNVDNSIRQNLRAVMEKTPGLRAPERKAFERAIRGNPAQNLLRAIGKTSPLTGGLTGVVNTVIAGVNPALMPYMLGTSASKVAADAITARNVEAIRRVIAAGGPDAVAATRVVKANPALARAVAQAGIGAETAGGGLLAPRPQPRGLLAQ